MSKAVATEPKPQSSLVPRLRFPEFVDAGEWEENTLGVIAELRHGYAFKSSSYSKDGKYRIVTIANVQQGCLLIDSTNRIQELPIDIQMYQVLAMGDILVSMTGNVGRVCRVDQEGLLLNQRVGKLLPIAIEPNFLYQMTQLKRYRVAMQLKASGGAQGNLSAADILAYRCGVPVTSSEQQRIASCLSSLDSLITAHTQKLNALKTYKKGLMQQLFPREVETQPRLRFPEFQNAGEWEVTELGGLSDVRDGTHDSPSFLPTGRPLVTSKNLRPDGTLDLENVSLISQEDYDQINKRSKVTVGDILFGMIGTIGNPVRIKSEGFAIKNVALIKEVGPLSNAFVVQLLQSEYVAAIFAVLNTGNSQKFIALGKIRGLPIPAPSLA